ncbi:MAG: FG-GAP repeat domain-containing protein [Myxococcota bacterium]
MEQFFRSFFIFLTAFFILTACEGASFAPKDAETDTNQNNENNINNDAGTDQDNVDTCSLPDVPCGDDCCTDGARCRNGSCCDLENLCGASFCCEEGESCMGGYCHLDCEYMRCLDVNQQEMCCGSEEICFMNECIIPGAVCENDSQCLLDEYCELSVGKCLPIPESTCEYFPPTGQFSPITEWSWPPPSGSPVLPDHVDVLSPPVIGDMNGDGIPEVAFVAYKDSCAGGNYNTGVLTILRGSDGTELLRLDDPARRLGSSTMPALGDIDLDGLPEVVVMQEDKKLLAYKLDGTLIWESEASPRPMAWGGISIGDLNYDSIPEIVFGTTIYNPLGEVICAGTGGGTGGHNSSIRSISVLSDVTGDGYLEIVAGNTVYDRDCNLIFESPADDGYAAVADIYDSNGDPNLDGLPEIVIVGNGYVTIINGQDGTILWGPEVIPGGQNRGGAPVIADFDGDGHPEIGTAGGAYMIVYDPHDATPILWQKATKDTSSALTGCTVFDFEADGSAEIIYTDECFVYIYRGTDGEILFKEPNNTRTHNEYPIVADVDGDGNSELIVTSNVCVWNCEAEPGWSGPAKRGITVYGDVDLNWV